MIRNNGNRMKVILSFLLALSMIISDVNIFPMTANATQQSDNADARSFSYDYNFIEVIPEVTEPIIYDGQPHPELLNVTVRFNGTTLTRDTHYTVDFARDKWSSAARNAVNGDGIPVGSPTETLDYHIRITGIGDYSGEWNSLSDRNGRLSNYATETQFRIMPRLAEEIRGDYTLNQGREYEVIWTWTLDTNGKLTINGSGAMPSNLRYQWRGQGDQYLRYIKTVEVNTLEGKPDVTEICEYAFSDAKNLVDVTLPESVTKIGEGAFQYCNRLESIHAPDVNRMPLSLQTVINRAIGINTYNLKVFLPDHVTTFEINNARYDNQVYCKHGTTTERTLKAGGYQFLLEGYDGYWLKQDIVEGTPFFSVYQYKGPGGEVELPAYVDSVRYADIFYIPRLAISRLIIPGNISTLNVDAFRGLSRCSEIIIRPGELTSLPANLLSGNYSDVTLTVPDNVTELPSDGFTGFSGNLTMIVGANSAAYNWAIGKGYTPENGAGNLHYKIRTVTQPFITPSVLTIDNDNIEDIVITKNDGSETGSSGTPFSFVGLKNEDTELTQGTDYSVTSDGAVTINATYLSDLPAGTTTITFDYEGAASDGTQVEDTTLTLTIASMASPALVVKDHNNATIDPANYSVQWKNSSGNVIDNTTVPAGTSLSYTITPGDALKVGGIQYYKITSGTVTLNERNQRVEVSLGKQGTVTINPKDGTDPLPEGYTIKWYASRDSSSSIGTGATSPMKDAGTILYYDVIMSGANADNYNNVLKQAVTVGFGNTSTDKDITGKNNITLRISGTKRNGGDISPDNDCTIKWYTKSGDNFVDTGKTGATLTGLENVEAGTEYYYEIAPKDSSSVKNWLEFYGKPASDSDDGSVSTKVTVRNERQNINVTLNPVGDPVTLSGSVENYAQVGSENLSFSLSQEPWKGYQSGASTFSYKDIWASIQLTENGNFSASVPNFATTVKVSDTSGNFASAYQTKQAGELTGFALTLPGEAVPETLPIRIKRKYPSSGNQGYSVSNLSYGYKSEGIFSDMTFTLRNGNTVIAPENYTVTPTEIRFTNSTAVHMGDSLTLSVAIPNTAPAQLITASDTLTVRRKYGADEDGGFDLSYTEYGNYYINRSSGRFYETYALYNSAGNLADSGTIGWAGIATGGQVAAGTYTLCVWQEQSWLHAPSTYQGLQAILSSGEYQTKTVTIQNGMQTVVNTTASPEVGDHSMFTEDSGFSDQVIETRIEEWTQVNLNYEVEPNTAEAYANTDGKYSFWIDFNQSTLGDDLLTLRYDSASRQWHHDKYISVYSEGALDTESRVYVGDTHYGHDKGFHLETEKSSGTLCFYVKSTKGGTYRISATGERENGIGFTLKSSTLGSMDISSTGASAPLSFTSDFLRTSDNGANDSNNNYNGVWYYTTPEKQVKLYMDGVEIASTTSNGVGIASFSFKMDRTYVGSATVASLRSQNTDWSLAGYHELYAETVLGDSETLKSETTVMECITKENFTPAVLTRITLSAPAWGNTDLMTYQANTESGPKLTTYYQSSTLGELTYRYTATVENAANLHDVTGLVLYVTARDGREHMQIMEREAGTNRYTAEVTADRLLMTHWSVAIHTKEPLTLHTDNNGVAMAAPEEDANIVSLLGSSTRVTLLDGSDGTVQQAYTEAQTELNTKETNGTLESDRRYYFDENADIVGDIAKSLLDEDIDVDDSPEKMNELYELFGIHYGVAADVNYESWGDDYISVSLSGGREMRSRGSVEKLGNGRWLYTAESVLIPTQADPEGYSKVQKMYFEETGTATLLTFNRRGAGPVILLDGEVSTFPVFSKNVTNMVNDINNRLKKAYQKQTGRSESTRDSMNYNVRMNLLNGVNSGYSQHQKQTKANMTIQGRLNDLLESGTLSPERQRELSDIKAIIDQSINTSNYSDIGTALAAMVDGAGEYALGGKPKSLLKDQLKKYASEKFGEEYGYEIPTSWSGLATMLSRYYFKDRMSGADFDLFMALFRLNEILNEMGLEENKTFATCGGGVREVHDPEGIIYEAVLSNPVEGATATLYQKTNAHPEGVQWDAENYGQINPQVTNASGQYQWFVPEGEWQVRVERPAARTDLQAANDSSGHPAANLNDGSTPGWLPVMPIQMGINIPLVSNAVPAIEEGVVYADYAEVVFTRYMKVESLNAGTFTVKDEAGNVVDCEITLPDEDVDPSNNSRRYARTVRLTPRGGNGFDPSKRYRITATGNLEAYNNKSFNANYDSGLMNPRVVQYTVTFNSMGGSAVASQQVQRGRTAVRPNAPTKTNRYFIGWYTSDNCRNLFDFSTPITGNITLYAGWDTERPSADGDDTPERGGGSDGSGGSGGSGSSSGGGSDNTTTQTSKYTDANGNEVTFTVTTNKTTGQVTSTMTIKYNDGSKLVVKEVKNKDGSGSVNETKTTVKGAVYDTESDFDKTGKVTTVITTVTNAAKTNKVKTTYSVSGSKLSLTDIDTTKKTVNIPATVLANGKVYKVTAVAKNAFKGQKKIVKVTIGKNVKRIGAGAFRDNTHLKEIIVKGKLTYVGKKAFYNIHKNAVIKIKASKKNYRIIKKEIKEQSDVPIRFSTLNRQNFFDIKGKTWYNLACEVPKRVKIQPLF